MSSRRYRPRGVPRALFVRLCAAAVAASAAAAPPALAGVRIVDQHVDVDLPARRVFFAVRFDAAPDLFTLDEFGRVADTFQYEIDADGPVSDEAPVGQVEAVVRGDEVHVAGALRVRAAGEGVAPDPDPEAGGWGRVRETVPFVLDGADLSFQVPLAALGDDDGAFSYRLFTAEFGLTVDQVEGVAGRGATALPLPPAVWSALASAAALAGFAALRRVIRPRARLTLPHA